MSSRAQAFRQNLLFFAVHLLVFFLLLLGFAFHQGLGSRVLPAVWLTLTMVSYPVVYLLPGVLVSSLLLWLPRPRVAGVLSLLFGVLWTSAGEFLMVLDLVVLLKFGYHLNGLVFNLMFTPGGFEAMGLGMETLLPAGLGIFLGVSSNVLFAVGVRRWRPLSSWGERAFPHPGRLLALSAGVVVLFLFGSMMILGYADFYSRRDVLAYNNTYPMTFTLRMRKFLRRLGCQEPPREEQLFDGSQEQELTLNYPVSPIRRTPPEKPLNILWLTAESLRADHLNPDTMPETWALAQRGLWASLHYSGGHGTRPAMFSMFYGIYGTNWGAFLNARRPPLLFDWLKEDGYDFLVQTSARFTYPEFDQTIFASVPSPCLREIKDKEPWRRDVIGTDRILAFLRERTLDSPPFFAFHFFESTHAPYTFDESQALRSDYIQEINYTTISVKDAPGIYNRQVNAAHHVDRQVGRILAAIQENPALAGRTIVVVTGDHGEEFYEKGHLGHNSTFVEEQIRTPLVIFLPGIPPRKLLHRSHHTDIIPTLAPFFGVENNPGDYSVGQSLLEDGYNREFFIVSGWKLEAFVCPEFKYILPVGAGRKYYGRNLLDAADRPGGDENAILRSHFAQFIQANQDMYRFVRKKKK
ncbi:MAG: sulfatase-like hydrolase/transferase [Oligosphaeraceae bacterium]